MKKLFYYSLLFLASAFTGCSNEIGEATFSPDYIEPGASVLTVGIDFLKPSGYAVGDDVAPGVGTPEEVEIRSLAFFVKTSHAFGKYFSTEQLLSANGFTQALAEATPGTKGSYTASFKVRSAKFENTCEVIAVANYHENGLTEMLSKVTTMKQLKQVMTNQLDGTNNLEAPLLMYGQNAAVTLADQQTTALSLVMERMVARVDVVNLAADAVTPADGFILESVRLLNAPGQSMLVPEQGQVFEGVSLPTRALAAGGDAFVKFTYLYESPNDEQIPETSRPRIEVKGTFRGAPVLKEVPFKEMDKPGTPGAYFPILRNHHYVVNILPAKGIEDITFDVKVKEWEGGESVLVKPSMKAPKVDGFTLSLDAAALNAEGVTWDEATATLTLTKQLTQALALDFTASAFQAPKAVIAAEGTSVSFIESSYLTTGDLTGYADGTETPTTPDENDPMPLKRTFTLTIPAELNIEGVAGVEAGSTHTNLLNIHATTALKTTITIVYKDQRTPAEPDPVP